MRRQTSQTTQDPQEIRHRWHHRHLPEGHQTNLSVQENEESEENKQTQEFTVSAHTTHYLLLHNALSCRYAHSSNQSARR